MPASVNRWRCDREGGIGGASCPTGRSDCHCRPYHYNCFSSECSSVIIDLFIGMYWAGILNSASEIGEYSYLVFSSPYPRKKGMHHKSLNVISLNSVLRIPKLHILTLNRGLNFKEKQCIFILCQTSIWNIISCPACVSPVFKGQTAQVLMSIILEVALWNQYILQYFIEFLICTRSL